MAEKQMQAKADAVAGEGGQMQAKAEQDTITKKGKIDMRTILPSFFYGHFIIKTLHIYKPHLICCPSAGATYSGRALAILFVVVST